MAARNILVSVFVLACCFLHTSTGAPGEFTTRPGNTESAVGATTRLLCTVNITKSLGEKLYWHFEPKSSPSNGDNVATIGPFTNNNPTAFPRYTITGDDNGIYNLEISNTEPGDEGNYTCMIVFQSNVIGLATAELTTVRETAVKPTGAAICDNGTLMDTHNELEMVTISCAITGGVPLPILQIIRRREVGASHEVIPSTTSISDAGVVTETATFAMSHVDHNAMYRCVTLHPDKKEDVSLSCDFTSSPQVMFTPVLNVSPNEVYIDGDDDKHVVTLTCEVIANPPAVPVVWQYEESVLTTGEIGNDNTLTFSGVRESYIGQIINCTTTNSQGSGTASIELEELDKLLPFDTYILFIIIAGGCLLFFFLTCICIICCCQRDDDSDDDEKNLGYHVNESRPTSMRQNDNEDDIIDGYDPDNFSGGSEANLVRDQSHKSRASHKSQASQRSGISDRTDNRSSVRSNGYNDVNTFDNQAYSPDGSTGNNDVEFNTPLY